MATITVAWEFQSGWVEEVGVQVADVGQTPEQAVATRFVLSHIGPGGPSDQPTAAVVTHRKLSPSGQLCMRTRRYVPAGNPPDAPPRDTPAGWVPA